MQHLRPDLFGAFSFLRRQQPRLALTASRGAGTYGALMQLTDERIVAEVMRAFREVGEGHASLAMAGEGLMRRLIGLGHEAPAQLNPPATDTGD